MRNRTLKFFFKGQQKKSLVPLFPFIFPVVFLLPDGTLLILPWNIYISEETSQMARPARNAQHHPSLLVATYTVLHLRRSTVKGKDALCRKQCCAKVKTICLPL